MPGLGTPTPALALRPSTQGMRSRTGTLDAAELQTTQEQIDRIRSTQESLKAALRKDNLYGTS